MTDTDRYTGPGRRGANRPMTADEIAGWQGAVAQWHNDPPWTAQARADNKAVRVLLVTLFEDAVSLTDLAETAGWGRAKIAGILHRAREAGMGTGSRRYIAPEPTAKQAARAAKSPFRRNLTADEAANLLSLYRSLPRYASGARGWKTEDGKTLVKTMRELVEDQVALETIGEALGMSRQAVHLRLNAKSADAAA